MLVSFQNQLLSKMEGDLQAMRSSQKSLSSELGTELMAHLSSEDQNEVRINYEMLCLSSSPFH